MITPDILLLIAMFLSCLGSLLTQFYIETGMCLKTRISLWFLLVSTLAGVAIWVGYDLPMSEMLLFIWSGGILGGTFIGGLLGYSKQNNRA